MNTIKIKPMDQKITTLYEDYRKGLTNRRQFVRKLAVVAGSSAAAMAMLPILDEMSPGISQYNQILI